MDEKPDGRKFLLTRPSRDVTNWTILFQRIHLEFLLTRPSRDVTDLYSTESGYSEFLLTRPSRDVTQVSELFQFGCSISTHTSLAGRDWEREAWFDTHADFYSHVPRGT